MKFLDSERIYKINKEGEVIYLGKEEKLMLEATINSSPESNTTPRLFQQIEIETSIPMQVEQSQYIVTYAWNTNKHIMPEDEKFLIVMP